MNGKELSIPPKPQQFYLAIKTPHEQTKLKCTTNTSTGPLTSNTLVLPSTKN